MLRKRRWLVAVVVIGSAGYLAGKLVQQVLEDEAAEYASIMAHEPTGAGLPETAIERLRELGRLHAQGILNDDEFAAAKTTLLSAG